MKLEIEYLKENEDGSAEISFQIDEEGKEFLLQYALKSLLLETAKETLDRRSKEILDGEVG